MGCILISTRNLSTEVELSIKVFEASIFLSAYTILYIFDHASLTETMAPSTGFLR